MMAAVDGLDWKKTAARWVSSPVVLGLASALGAAWYAFQAVGFVNRINPVLDEGTYLYKGLLFATGRYAPYQAYGPWTNKMPLSFLIPGWVQAWFGPGLLTGRVFAVVLSLLMLLGLFLTARRLGGWGWGTAVVWAMALNPYLIATYSQALSQGLVACMLVWICFFILGPGRLPWQIAAGSVLAGLLVMTRENMLPVVPCVVLYVAWENGWRTGLLSLAGSGAALAGVHAAFWPDVLRNWAKWLPAALTPFLDAFRVPKTSTPAYREGQTLTSLLVSFFSGFRYHFAATFGMVVGLLLWPSRREWKSRARFRAAVFLSVLLWILLLAHAWASLGNDYCGACFPVYLAFFSPAALLLIVVSASSWRPSIPLARQAAAGLAIVGIAGGIFFAANADIVRSPFFQSLQRSFLYLDVPRMKSGQFLPGTVKMWELIANRFRLGGDHFWEVLPGFYTEILAGIGMALAVVFLAVVAGGFWVARRRLIRNGQSGRPVTLGYVFLTGTLLAGTLLSTTYLFSGELVRSDCETNPVTAYAEAGEYLAGVIPPGSKVDWRGDGPPVILLYLPGIRIYPPELNATFSYRLGGDPDELYRYGYWNETLAQRWLGEADFVLISATASDERIREILAAGYHELNPPPPVGMCPKKLEFRVYSRVK